MNRTRKPRSDAKLAHLPGETVKQYAARVERFRRFVRAPEQRAAETKRANIKRDKWRRRKRGLPETAGRVVIRDGVRTIHLRVYPE